MQQSALGRVDVAQKRRHRAGSMRCRTAALLTLATELCRREDVERPVNDVTLQAT